VRIENQIKKISKVSNVEKSRKIMEELLLQKEKLEAMEGVDLFKEIKILSQVDRVMINLLRGDKKFAEFGFLGVILDCVMDLNGLVRLGCKLISLIFKFKDQECSQDLYDLTLPWLHMYF
jgi:hypothetical protein